MHRSSLSVVFAGLFSALILPAAHASPQSDALAECLDANMTADDQKVLVQWAYVALGKTSAARAVQAIPAEKTKAVESAAQRTLSTLVLRKCSKPALALLVKDPKTGLQDTLQSLASRLIQEELKRRTSPVLPITITDLLKPRS